jgi:hypothetical protein
MFFEYVLEKLKPVFLTRPGPLQALVKGAAESLDAARADILFLREQFLVEKAEISNVRKIAAARGVKQWPIESDNDFRTRAAIAYLFWKKGDKAPGMKEVCEAFGFSGVKILEHPEFEFSVSSGLNAEASEAEFLIKLINEIKPARSILKELIARNDLEAKIYTASPALLGVINNNLGCENYYPGVFLLSPGTSGKIAVCSNISCKAAISESAADIRTAISSKASVNSKIKINFYKNIQIARVKNTFSVKATIKS